MAITAPLGQVRRLAARLCASVSLLGQWLLTRRRRLCTPAVFEVLPAETLAERGVLGAESSEDAIVWLDAARRPDIADRFRVHVVEATQSRHIHRPVIPAAEKRMHRSAFGPIRPNSGAAASGVAATTGLTPGTLRIRSSRVRHSGVWRTAGTVRLGNTERLRWR